MITLAALVQEFEAPGLALVRSEDADRVIGGIASLEAAGPSDLVFLDKPRFLPLLAARRPAAVVTTAKLCDAVAELGCSAVLVASNVPLAHALIKARYAGRDFVASAWRGVHPAAFVDPSAELAPEVVVEPRAVVGARTRIGARSRIMAGAVVEHDVVIGADCVIFPAAVIGYASRLGDTVQVGSGSIIGSEGFGFAEDSQRRSHPIPQTGVVVLEDRVRVGANCCIDRATYHETRIGAGTKLDNLCHVAHNVTIGEDCLLTAMLCVAGSTRIGNRVMTSGQTGIIDHIEICDDVVLVHRAGVVKSISAPGAYASLPALPLNEYLKNTASARGASDLRRRVAALERARGQKESRASKPGPEPALGVCENS